MIQDSTEEIFLASRAGPDGVRQLRRIASRHACEFRRSRSFESAYFAGRAYYEMPPATTLRSQKVRKWLQLAISTSAESVFPLFLLGCLAFDEGDYARSLSWFERIRAGAFAELSIAWLWRDIKLLELRCASAVRVGVPEQIAAAATAYAEAIQSADEVDVAAPHELVNALIATEEPRALPALARAMERHLQIGWNGPLGIQVAKLAEQLSAHGTVGRS